MMAHNAAHNRENDAPRPPPSLPPAATPLKAFARVNTMLVVHKHVAKTCSPSPPQCLCVDSGQPELPPWHHESAPKLGAPQRKTPGPTIEVAPRPQRHQGEEKGNNINLTSAPTARTQMTIDIAYGPRWPRSASLIVAPRAGPFTEPRRRSPAPPKPPPQAVDTIPA